MSSENITKLTRAVQKRGQPFRVLVVDDEKWVREVFQDFCKVTDAFEVDQARNGAEAVEKIRQSRYDLVTLDLIMPEMSGLEVLSAIQDVSPHVPVMVITGNATEKLVNEAGVMGACRVLYKPVMLEHFLSEITSALVRD
ncbi:MAG: response regulator [candidate division Zixibacteria bacterium]|nr:response regulator [candidate division Zixibacteria bacterium]